MTSSSKTRGGGDPLWAAQGRVPDFFVVGHHKSGTTAMYQMLRRHPQIFMPDMKEPQFFGRDRPDPRTLPPRPGGAPRTYAETRPKTYDEYLRLFAGAAPDQRVGDASPSYLYWPKAAAEIAQAQPSARIIAILREPASFLYSLHLQMLRDHVQRERDLRTAIAHEGTAPDAGAHVLRYTDRVRYVEQLRRYHEVFASEQVLVLIYDDFRADNHSTMRTVLAFLDVDHDTPIEPIDVNRALVARSRRLDDWSRGVRTGRGPVSRRARATFKALTPDPLRRKMIRAAQRNVVYEKPAPPDPGLVLELRKRFKGEVVAASEYLGRDLVSLWGYDGLD